MIERTIQQEGYDCDYQRRGWIQARDLQDQQTLQNSVHMSQYAGFDDWQMLTSTEVVEKSGMQVTGSAGYSNGAATFHPAKWVWSLLQSALKQPTVELFTRTRVLQVLIEKGKYHVQTDRGTIEADYVINATESYTALLHKQFRNRLFPFQTQAAFAKGAPAGMKAGVAISSLNGFFSRQPGGMLLGSDESRVPHHKAGVNQPSRFITRFLLAEMLEHFGTSPVCITHEWSGTPGFTEDEFPIVGVFDGHRQYIIGGMCGSGTGVSFNAARHVVFQILGIDQPNDYPAPYFSPTRILDPEKHDWPQIET